MLFLLVALAAAPVHIESLGFTVEVQGDAVQVIEVTTGSSAEAAGLTVGTRIVRVMAPMYLFGKAPLAQLSEVDLHDKLSTTHLEPLTFFGFVEGKKKVLSIKRIDPPPPESAPKVLTAEQLKRLSTMHMSVYYAQLSILMKPPPRAPEPLLSFGGAGHREGQPPGRLQRAFGRSHLGVDLPRRQGPLRLPGRSDAQHRAEWTFSRDEGAGDLERSGPARQLCGRPDSAVAREGCT